MTVQELHTSGLLFACVCDQETEQTIRLVPVQNYDLKYEGIVGGIKEAMKYLKTNRSPRILIVDLSQSDLPINDVTSLSEVCEPGVEVIAIGTRNDVGIFRELVKLGIRDYLVKPLTSAHIIRSIESIVLRNKSTSSTSSFSKFGKIISFIGARGGVGTTTLAVNSAWVMAEKYFRRISFIDPDLQLGSVSQFLDLDVSSNLQEILEAPERVDDSSIDRFMTQYSPHLMIMCGQASLEENQIINPEAFDPVIHSMLGNFHYTIFDLPRCFSNRINLHILGNSNLIVLVTDLSILGLKDSHRYLELFKRHRTTDQQVFIIVNKQGEYQKGEIEIEDFEKALSAKVDLVIPFNAQLPLQALTQGTPFMSQDVSSLLIDRMNQLTDKIMGRETPPKSAMNKLFSLFPFKK